MSYKDINSIAVDDKRIPKWEAQLAERGFDDTELWGLDTTIAEFVLPRLIRFKEIAVSFPAGLTSEEWDEKLDKMVAAFKIMTDENRWPTPSGEEWEIVTEGCRLFGQYLPTLWD